MLKKFFDSSIRYIYCVKQSRNFSNLKLSQDSKLYRRKIDKDEVLPTVLSNSTIKSLNDWKRIRDEILNTSRHVTDNNIDVLTVSFCLGAKRYDLGKSYYEFLKKENIKPNLAMIGRFFALYEALYDEKMVNEKDEENILSMYVDLRKTYDVLDSITGEHVICGLSATKNWRECLKIMDEIKISCKPNTVSYNAVTKAAFRNNDNDLGWNLLEEMIGSSRNVSDQTYFSILEQVKSSTSRNEVVCKLERLFDFFSYLDVKCSTNVAKKITEVVNVMGASSKLTYVSKRGVCRNCNKRLEKMALTRKEFAELKEAFFKHVIVGKNVFIKTTPEELEQFQNFTDKMKQFDVVVDGLNVAYAVGSKQNVKVYTMLVASVVKHYKKQGKRILVFGRKHMEKWQTYDWNFVNENATVFLTENLSQDDPYILYCALASGLNTIIVSRDMMRSHAFLLKDSYHKKLFNRWLSQIRCELLYADMNSANFKDPLPYMVTAQKDKNIWHVPYDVDSIQKPGVNYNWICLKF